MWTKFPLDVDEADPDGDLTPEMRGKIDGYVERTFGSRVPAENVRLLTLLPVMHAISFAFCFVGVVRVGFLTDGLGRSSGSRTGRS